jgi:hypothetical protein
VNDSRTAKLWNQNLLFVLPLNANFHKDPENLQMELICCAILIKPEVF